MTIPPRTPDPDTTITTPDGKGTICGSTMQKGKTRIIVKFKLHKKDPRRFYATYDGDDNWLICFDPREVTVDNQTRTHP